MALTKASALHWWSARYGPIPVIGGRPTHTRNSAGAVVDASGMGYNAIINTPRFSWETDKATTANEKRAALLLEQARTNQVTAPIDFSNAAWIKTGCTVAPGIDDPFGGTNAQRLTTTAANATLQQQLANSTSLIRTNSLWVRRRAGVGGFGFYEPAQGAFLSPTLTDKWQRFQNTTPTASISRWSDIRFGNAGAGDVVDLYLAQMEDGQGATGEIPTSGATRAADLFYWGCSFPIQPLVMYLRWIESGDFKTGNLRLAQIGGNPEMSLYYNNGTLVAETYNSTTASQSISGTLTPAIGDTVEACLVFGTDNLARLVYSINGAAPTAVAPGSAAGIVGLAQPSFISLNSVSDGSSTGLGRYLDLRVVKYADIVSGTVAGMLTEVANFELGPNGDLL